MKSKIIFSAILILFIGFVHAQQPDLLPTTETDPLELTLFNIIMYFVMPVVIFIIYLWYRKSKRKK